MRSKTIGESVVALWLVSQTEIERSRVQTPLQSGPEVIKLSMKFQPLINAEIVKNHGKFRFKTQKLVIYPAHKC